MDTPLDKDAELKRVLFVCERDGLAGAVRFCTEARHAYIQSLRGRAGVPYRREYIEAAYSLRAQARLLRTQIYPLLSSA